MRITVFVIAAMLISSCGTTWTLVKKSSCKELDGQDQVVCEKVKDL